MKSFSVENISSQNLMKSSVQRSIKATILKQYPKLEDHIENIFPKKGSLFLGKCINHVTVILGNNELLFFQIRNGPWIPNLKLVHKYPFMMPQIQVDKGAIKHVLRGSNIMCPGVTSPGGKLDDVEANTVVQIRAEDKEFPCAVGITTMSSKEIIEINKDMCIENIHYLNDGLWNFKIET
ncbi:putative cell cycle regulator protein [Plasmodium gaboni]|uniref:Cell cycle regulator protein, putative n=1 Tax=Plasmodium gaboni TaxID=647221 RepID=A0A151LTI1_9APIC|nr:putative cell cycle regulator protein [Plasmodium gaboni]XP_028537137.1 cell cycle regulator protein, putative [Plasmodium sp. gorilla clade G2]SOV21497.1 cell cycle regulator protein, putative [Plasmodium sp. DRC-Itaito]SOV74532.1 cell cycle regulator protein, putative [Plasmodium sp. gorilla clade G3]KYO02490.1 putative cell cycle regulator protein [Plasmodium gaboni]SOV11949.1 cell cycle regulator protein, putative [Plasmodium sp. gorilla clade G2]SOV12119.1 cell cycle regulator protein